MIELNREMWVLAQNSLNKGPFRQIFFMHWYVWLKFAKSSLGHEKKLLIGGGAAIVLDTIEINTSN